MNEIDDYRATVAERLNLLKPYLQNYALGDFSETIPIPEVEDEFTELVVGIRLMVEDFQELLRNLRERDKFLSVFFKQSAVGIALISIPDGNYLRFNDRFCELLGRPRKDLETHTVFEITHEGDRKITHRNIADAMEKKRKSWSQEKRYIDGKGNPLWVLTSVQVIEDGKGNPIEEVSIVQDITDQMKAREKLKEIAEEMAVKNEELARINQLSVGRELRMIKLKEQVNTLALELGRQAPYDLSFTKNERN